MEVKLIWAGVTVLQVTTPHPQKNCPLASPPATQNLLRTFKEIQLINSNPLWVTCNKTITPRTPQTRITIRKFLEINPKTRRNSSTPCINNNNRLQIWISRHKWRTDRGNQVRCAVSIISAKMEITELQCACTILLAVAAQSTFSEVVVPPLPRKINVFRDAVQANSP